MEIESTVEIAQPPSVVFDFITDEENLPLWVSNLVSFEHLKGDEGEVGAISKHVYNENGKVVEMIEELTEVVPNQKLSLVLRSNFMEMNISNLLYEVNSNFTKLHVKTRYNPKNLMMKLYFFFTKRKLLERQDEDIYKLKNAVEKLNQID